MSASTLIPSKSALRRMALQKSPEEFASFVKSLGVTLDAEKEKDSEAVLACALEHLHSKAANTAPASTPPVDTLSAPPLDDELPPLPPEPPEETPPPTDPVVPPAVTEPKVSVHIPIVPEEEDPILRLNALGFQNKEEVDGYLKTLDREKKLHQERIEIMQRMQADLNERQAAQDAREHHLNEKGNQVLADLARYEKIYDTNFALEQRLHPPVPPTL